MYIDRDGKSAVWILVVLAVWLMFNLNADDPNTMVNYAESQVNKGTYFRTIEEAAGTWASMYGPKGSQENTEFTTMIVSFKYGGNNYYVWSFTYTGTNDTVWWGILFGYGMSLLGSGQIQASIHNHPNSKYPSPSTADRILLYLPEISRSFIAGSSGYLYEDHLSPGVDFYEAFRDLWNKEGRGNPSK